MQAQDFENGDLETTTGSESESPTTIGQTLILSRTHVDPPPFLDVLSFHSSRLLPESRQEIAEHELEFQKRRGIPTNSSPSKSNKLQNWEDAAQLDELLESVHLLLEPIQLPDLSHTGVFDPDMSLLRPVTPSASIPKAGAESTTKLKLSKLDKSDEIKLFYPTGAKNANMRDYIKETIEKHFSTEEPPSLCTSVSAPILRSPELDNQQHSGSPSKTRSKTKKKNKFKDIKSPLKISLTAGALLNPHLTKQARDVITAVRANSSKINELISK
ncbi:hypothetical protein PPTG_17905 [Phytophthora nicotianae INRA-310]|uniref:Uncharacterized protein n=3 Tax=Phytophthora nicotianae TaxID=4792 RepID=W2PIL4_PHYN3|nr:hypothetical protein PPTG_17905 [Phytophthora nicotianae INRA-310]ETN00712.1 hypothetical protein PPTG_17905 [Phytophthora nicotianae INRA-310]